MPVIEVYLKMRKYGVFSTTIFIAIIFAGAYGILHDEITYTISPEYFTKFKLIQFQVGVAVPYRLGAASVGLSATFWTGLIIGPLLGITGLLFRDYRMMRKYIWKAMYLNFCIAIIAGFIGFLIGEIYLKTHPPRWYYYPLGLVDKANFIVVGTIHNASYLGGFLGLLIAIVYLIFTARRVNKILPK